MIEISHARQATFISPFQKTNTNRQAELVRHVLANPVWITEQAKRPALAHTPSPHTTA